MQYTVVKEFRQEDFEMEVTSKLAEGWTLQGGVSIALNAQTNNTWFAQAMVKVGE